ncbi:MAG: DNA topoisomerase IV subunit A [Rhodocyclaceae bacterium]|nr:DNA topoisomerase IV subunit A [Rhodocyclaceae bacterium]MCB1891219.1 DNA topoisomerase IV subunit A [Rhodocyclaceae bacterium]MCP5296094.1 DNA topoisomerase IV subunit A [Zoogloeaceae bacterium]MCW5595359.1 DNA topoisomerase IV subunit A [Rhodocyclaceae bacterium]
MSNETPDLFEDLKVSAGGTAHQPPSAPPPSGAALSDDALPLDLYVERAYLTYAMSVVTGRALPHVEDGQKPVQRRILYAMHEMGLRAGAKPVKSARVVGDVIGKFHPHGDQSVYDAMVRVAQDFSLRYPLIDGQGNFGSRDGDSAAAMRYTEARLTPIAELLLGELDRGTVDFAPNYDGAFKEPVLLPARLPMVLLNGASGIAVGMATEIPPHNLREVAQAAALLVRNPKASLSDLLQHVKGPDYPGGGQIISQPKDIADAYANGRGSLRMRARWRIEDLARGQWRIVVQELPHGVSAAQIAGEIETLTNPQPRQGRKDVTQEQKNLKQLVLSVLDTMRDESTDKEPVRLILEPKSKNQDVQEMMNILLANTSLETNVSLNFTMLGRDGRPQQKNLAQIVTEWVDFRYATVERRTRHRLDEVERRLHILDGRMIAFLSIDKVIKVIRNSDEPKQDLMAKFSLSAIQAEDILEIRLRQLARLEGIRIEKELADLKAEQGTLKRLLAERKEMTKLLLKEIEQDMKQYGDERRTLVEAVAPVAPAEIQVADEPVTVILSKNGWVRRRDGHGLDRMAITYKAGDYPFLVAETRTTWPLVVVDSNGRAYSLRVSDLPGGRGDGTPIATMIDLQAGARVAAALSDAPETAYLFANSGGYGFIARVSDLVTRQKAGKAFMTLEKDERMLHPAKAAGNTIAAVSENGRLLLFAVEEMKSQSAGRGVLVMGLDAGESLVGVVVNDGSGVVVEGVGRGGRTVPCKVTSKDMEKYRLHRARKGCLLPVKMKPAFIL